MVRKKTSNPIALYQHLIIPSALGGVIAWFFSGSLSLGVIVAVAVWVGNWIGQEIKKNI